MQCKWYNIAARFCSSEYVKSSRTLTSLHVSSKNHEPQALQPRSTPLVLYLLLKLSTFESRKPTLKTVHQLWVSFYTYIEVRCCSNPNSAIENNIFTKHFKQLVTYICGGCRNALLRGNWLENSKLLPEELNPRTLGYNASHTPWRSPL